MAKQYTWRTLETRCRSIVSELLNVPLEEVGLHTHIMNDLKADSLDAVELVMEFEDEFGLIIADNVFGQLPTLADGIQEVLKTDARKILAQVETQVVSFEIGEYGGVRVKIRSHDGSWTYADGTSVLPSTLIVSALSHWRSALAELEELINSTKTKESDLQKFMELYPELLAGDEYDLIIPQATISRDDADDWKADFVLAPVNQVEFARVIDLKLPTMTLLKRPRSGHAQFSAKLWDGICQLKEYSRAFDRMRVRQNFRDKYKIDIYKPDLHLVAGRCWDLKLLDGTRALRKDTEVKIEDWDSLLSRLKRRFR